MRHEVVLPLPESFIAARDRASPIRQLTLSTTPTVIIIVIISATCLLERTRSFFPWPHSFDQIPPSPPLPPITIAANPDGASSPNLGTYENGGYSLIVRLPCSLAEPANINQARRQLKGFVLVI